MKSPEKALCPARNIAVLPPVSLFVGVRQV